MTWKKILWNVVIWIFQIFLLIYLIEDTGAISGTAIFLGLNLIFIAMEYKINPEFKEWFDTNVKVGIEMVERRIYNK